MVMLDEEKVRLLLLGKVPLSSSKETLDHHRRVSALPALSPMTTDGKQWREGKEGRRRREGNPLEQIRVGNSAPHPLWLNPELHCEPPPVQ